MPVSFASFEIARSGLTVNERGLWVTGQNISNVNTAGFVRQQLMIKNGPVKTEFTATGMHQYGYGADVQQIRQVRHTFLDNLYRQENTTLGYWETRSKTFQDVQAILAEPLGSGLQNILNEFWDSWQELSKEPDSLTMRALVRQRGQVLVDSINHMGEQLNKLQNDLNSEIRVRIDEVNAITSQIAKLNLAILKSEVSGDQANDYRDQRNNLVDRLSKLVNAEVIEMSDGQLDITVGGYYLVSKGISTNLYAAEKNTGEIFVVPKLEGSNIEVPLRSGILKGLMESRGEVSAAGNSVLNGNPKATADIVIVVDASDSSAGYLANVRNNISSLVAELQRAGADYNLKLVMYGDAASAVTDYGTDLANLLNGIDIDSITYSTDTGNNFGGASGVIESLEDAASTFRTGADRYALVFTNESVDGNNGLAVTDAADYINRLNAIGIHTSVVTQEAFGNEGEVPAEIGWNSITWGTGGKVYDIASADFAKLMERIALDVDNRSVSYISESENIVSDLKRRLNALVNVLAREVNSVHRSGKTLVGDDGGDFFTAVNSAYPMQMGNLRLNLNLSGENGLNNIVAAATASAGDNQIALKIANLRGQAVLTGPSGLLSLDDYYQAIIAHVGNYGSDADRISQNQLKLVQSADSYRQSITGVSMDEEMTNMMKYKYAYDAASRAINVIDEMLRTVIERTGLAGR